MMLDNATNNDTLVQGIESRCRKEGIAFDARLSRLRCMPHTVHLAAIKVSGDIWDSHTSCLTTILHCSSWRLSEWSARRLRKRLLVKALITRMLQRHLLIAAMMLKLPFKMSRMMRATRVKILTTLLVTFPMTSSILSIRYELLWFYHYTFLTPYSSAKLFVLSVPALSVSRLGFMKLGWHSKVGMMAWTLLNKFSCLYLM